MLLLIDNYDSFVYNLDRYFRRLGQQTRVLRNDQIDLAEVHRMHPRAIVLSPGPCTPVEAGCCLEIVRQFGQSYPILGVCLGHQVIAQALGAVIERAAKPMHGRTSLIRHDQCGVFQGVANPLSVCRYHSLAVKPGSVPETLEISAQAEDGVIMAIRHRELPLVGLQFHPESILTQEGYALLAGFLRVAAAPSVAARPSIVDELEQRPPPSFSEPAAPVTF